MVVIDVIYYRGLCDYKLIILKFSWSLGDEMIINLT